MDGSPGGAVDVTEELGADDAIGDPNAAGLAAAASSSIRKKPSLVKQLTGKLTGGVGSAAASKRAPPKRAAPGGPALSGEAAKAASKKLFKHIERLKYQDEDWKTRDEALEETRQLIAAGALASDDFVSGHDGFEANLRELNHSLCQQLYDQRSVIAKSAVATLDVLIEEVGDHAAAERCMREVTLEGLLQMASSGNKVLAATGREGLPKLVECVRFTSLVLEDPGLLHWLRGMKQVPVKLCCLNGLLQALQAWPLDLLRPAHEKIEIALIEAAANQNGEVRVLARQCLLQHLENAPDRQADVDKWLMRYPDTKKSLEKDRLKTTGLSPEAREPVCIRLGDSGARTRNGRLGGGGSGGGDGGNGSGDGSANAPTKPTLKKQGTAGAKILNGAKALARTASKAAGLAPPGQLTSRNEFIEGGELEPAESKTPLERMRELRSMLDEGLVTQEEFDDKKAQILQDI